MDLIKNENVLRYVSPYFMSKEIKKTDKEAFKNSMFVYLNNIEGDIVLMIRNNNCIDDVTYPAPTLEEYIENLEIICNCDLEIICLSFEEKIPTKTYDAFRLWKRVKNANLYLIQKLEKLKKCMKI